MLNALNLLRRPCCSRLVRTHAGLLHTQALDDWIASPKQMVLRDTFTLERLTDLYSTLPTRDGSRAPYQPPDMATPLPYGAHLAFFHPRTPESLLRPDGTDADFYPPEPFTRRMWAGGRMFWDNDNPLLSHKGASASSTIASVEKKGFDKGNPMIFVNQRIEVTMASNNGKKKPSVVEERTHVYLNESASVNKAPREVRDIPPVADFSFKYTPSLTTLFRFSALTFNGHLIHLDKDYAQLKEGYPERLVHGPLTALMLLEATIFHKPTAKIKRFEYRARNPLIVNQPLTINGAWQDEHSATVWCVNDAGVVGMTGSIGLHWAGA